MSLFELPPIEAHEYPEVSEFLDTNQELEDALAFFSIQQEAQ